MTIFLCTADMYKYAMTHIERARPDWCKICTYGIFIPPISTPCRGFFYTLRIFEVPTYIVVGNNGKDSTKQRIEEIKKDFKNLKIKLVEEMHAKCILFSDGTMITGSMNITDSKYNEIGTVVKLTQHELLDMILYIDGIS